jgi:inorganic phosphate transporter, PiT family
VGTTLLVVVVVGALAFDFTNGFHDTANYVATWVGKEAVPTAVVEVQVRIDYANDITRDRV